MLTAISLVALLALARDGDVAHEPAAAVPGVTEANDLLEVRFLANEGFLLRVGEDVILLDAFLEKPYSFYGALPQTARETLLAGDGPLGGVDLALVSHAHGDHVQTAFAARFFESAGGEDAMLVSSPQVVDAITKALAPDSSARERFVKRLPEPEATVHWQRGKLRVDFLRLPHSGTRWKAMHQLGHRIEVDGYRVLHVGDAEGSLAAYAPYAEFFEELDVCFVPYWYFDSEAGRKLVAEHLDARLVVAMHVPPVEVTSVRERLAISHPSVVVFAEALESRRLARRARQGDEKRDARSDEDPDKGPGIDCDKDWDSE